MRKLRSLLIRVGQRWLLFMVGHRWLSRFVSLFQRLCGSKVMKNKFYCPHC
ncbi:hypothetical protein RchiOBHm_Chr2g0120001 [Rosa chinensis]|uniref:Uncharacterized protein n=1 Tax=Rosa chinensis TaxID=74649 RepID=A0A2P6RS72_ROSCH|nr:hypothetical protein RchiOBHm_Chr2g0120001 [Rosa chinensis]